MSFAWAQLPPGGGDDRVFATNDAVIVLDGASAHEPVPVEAATYAQHLGECIVQILRSARRPLSDCLAQAIAVTAQDLDLRPGHSPSSTVAIVRFDDDGADLLCLGDTLIVYPGGSVCDDRIDTIATAEAAAYRQRLANGLGYDATHVDLLRRLQREQRRHRNQPNGYWIAEADPAAAHHAIVNRLSLEESEWAVLATDGAYEPLRTLGIDWDDIPQDTARLRSLLTRGHSCEETDPMGIQHPRAKRHDDKTLAISTRHRPR